MTPVSVNTTPHAIRNTARGFTLIELMISLVLGLMITAAVLQVYIANVRTSAIQQSGSDLQYASIFGIQQLESHLRLANLGNQGVRTARVILERPASEIFTLRLPLVDAAMQAQLTRLQVALAGKPLRSCF